MQIGCGKSAGCMQAPQAASMTDEGSKSRSSSLEKQRRFLGRDRYMGFHDEPLHGSDSGGRPEQAQRAGSGIPLDVRAKGLCTSPHLSGVCGNVACSKL